MKKYLYLLLIVSTYASAQKGLVHYGDIEAIGTGRAKGPDSNAYMVFNNEKSYYVTAKDSLEKAENLDKQTTYMNDDDSGGSIHNGMSSSRLGDQVFNDLKAKTIYSSFSQEKQVYVREQAVKISWAISKETKKIGNFNCLKATGSFRGRKYTAWYAPAIAVPYGPWKLNGLPGLILEAYDANKNVYWYFKSLEYPSKTKESISNIRAAKGRKVDFLSISELAAFYKDEIQKSYEKTIIVSKQFPGVTAVKRSQLDYYIEDFEKE